RLARGGDVVERKSPAFGGVSAALAIVTLVMPFVLFAGVLFMGDPNDPRNQGWGWLGRVVGGVVLAVALAVLSGLIGTVSGIVALSRKERLPWLGIVGLVVNGAVLALLAVAYISSQTNPS